MGRLMSNVFQVTVSGNKYPRPGSNLRLHVGVDDRRTGKGRSGVRVDAVLKTDHREPVGVPAKPAKTDSQGYAVLTLKIPTDIEENSPSVDVTAWHERA